MGLFNRPSPRDEDRRLEVELNDMAVEAREEPSKSEESKGGEE